MTPLKLYRQWFTSLTPMWAFEVSNQIILDATLAPILFYTEIGDEFEDEDNNEDEDDRDDGEHEDFETMINKHVNNSPVHLLNAIDEQIAKENLDTERLLCQQILSSTTYTIIKFTDTNIRFNPKLIEPQMLALGIDKLQLADMYEIWHKKSSRMQHEGSHLKAEWEEFTAKHFNIETFFKQEYQ